LRKDSDCAGKRKSRRRGDFCARAGNGEKDANLFKHESLKLQKRGREEKGKETKGDNSEGGGRLQETNEKPRSPLTLNPKRVSKGDYSQETFLAKKLIRKGWPAKRRGGPWRRV